MASATDGAAPNKPAKPTACVDSQFCRWNFRREVSVFILWRRGRPHPAAVFFFGYSAAGAGDGGAGCQLPGHRERAAARDLRQKLPRVSTLNFAAGIFGARSRSLSFGEGVGRIRRRFSFSVIRRPALVMAVPAVSYRAIASARRRATCARSYRVCRLSILPLEFSARGLGLYPLAKGSAASGGGFLFRLFGGRRW